MDLLENYINKIYNDLVIKNNDINNDEVSISKLEEIFLSIEEYENKLNKIKNIINKIENLQSQFKLLYMNKIKMVKKNITEDINENINKNDLYKIENVNLTNNIKYQNKKYYTSPVVIISENSINNIINTPIYMLKETNEYCIKINNKLIKGNIGNIVDKYNQKKIKKCNRLYCNNKFFNKKECKFYHENNISNEIRNFPEYSWKPILKNKHGSIKYKNNKIDINNYDIENTRFIGSLDTLNQDLALTSIYEKKLRNKQLMHDILLYQILDNYLE